MTLLIYSVKYSFLNRGSFPSYSVSTNKRKKEVKGVADERGHE